MEKKEVCKKCGCDVFCIHNNKLYCIDHHKQNKVVFEIFEKSKKKIKNCNFCAEEKCVCNKTHKGIKISATEGELNALEDLATVDIKSMYLMNRDKEVEKWQERCLDFWRRLIKKVDYEK